jgi:glycosyltransferase involved in cell wall biosynthesis
MPIRVAQVMGHMAGGGVEATILNHYRYIDKSKVQFDFVIDSDSTVVPREEIESLGGRVFTVPPYKKIPQYLRTCETLFRKQKPDIVHSNINALSVFPLLAAKRAGIPVRIAHSHSTSNPREYVKTLMKNTLRPFSKLEPTHLAACSEYSARWLFGDKVVDAGNVRIIKNAIDVDQFTFNPQIRARKRAELGIDERRLVIGQVGRLCFQKNQVFTLEVFKRLLQNYPDAVLVVAGDGELRTEIRNKIHEFRIDNSVKLLGIRQDVHELYQAFDVLAFPSTYEGLPLTVIEAQASGLPVVASDLVSHEMQIVPGLVHVLPLSNPNRWITELSNATQGRNRRSFPQLLELAGYQIAQSAGTLGEWYESLIEEVR